MYEFPEINFQVKFFCQIVVRGLVRLRFWLGDKNRLYFQLLKSCFGPDKTFSEILYPIASLTRISRGAISRVQKYKIK